MYENKEHKKMFKVGKHWAVATIATVAFLGAATVIDQQAVHADTVDTSLVGQTENSQDIDPNTLTDAQKAAIQARDDAQATADDAQASADTAQSAVSAAQATVNSASAVQQSAQTAYDQAATATSGVTQTQKNADVASAQSAVNTASQALDAAQSQQAQKTADITAAQGNVDNAQAALDAAQTADAAQKAADVANAQSAVDTAQKNVASAQSTLDSAKTTLAQTPATTTTTQTVTDDTVSSISDGQTLAYAITEGKTTNDGTFGHFKEGQAQGNPTINDNVLPTQISEFSDTDVTGDKNDFNSVLKLQYDESDLDEIWSGDMVGNQLTDSQQKEMNTYLIMVLNHYRESLGLQPITSTNSVYNATQKRGQTLLNEKVTSHDDTITYPIFESAGLSDPAECLSGVYGETGDTMFEMLENGVSALDDLLNGDADSNWGHRQILLSESWNVIDGAFSVVNTAGGWALVFEGVQEVDDSGSALVSTELTGTSTHEETTTVANPAYTKAQQAVNAAQTAVTAAQTQLSTAQTALKNAQNESTDTATLKANLATAKQALATAQSEADGDVTGAQAALSTAQKALTAAQNEVVSQYE